MRQLRTCAIVFGLTISPGLCADEGPISSPGTGATAGGATVPTIDPKEASALDDAQAFGGVLGTALARGLEPEIVHFDRMAKTFGIPKFKKGDVVRDVLVQDENGIRSLTIRVRDGEGGRQDIVLMNARKDGETYRISFYVTSPEGRLLDTFQGQRGAQYVRVDFRRHVGAHKSELDFWGKWHQDVHRQMAEQD